MCGCMQLVVSVFTTLMMHVKDSSMLTDHEETETTELTPRMIPESILKTTVGINVIKWQPFRINDHNT